MTTIGRTTSPPRDARPRALRSRVAAFILAGGEGRRLRPLTLDTPKPALPFGPEGRIIDFVLESCLASGIVDPAVLTLYRPEPLEAYLAGAPARRFEAAGGALALVRAGRGGLRAAPGTADVILSAAAELPGSIDTALVLAADHVYRMDYRRFIAAHDAAAADLTIGAVEVPIAEASRFGVIEADAAGRVVHFVEKPRRPSPIADDPSRALASMGIYVFRRSTLEAARRWLDDREGLDFGHDVVPAILRRGGRVQVYRHRTPSGASGLWYDVGTPDALLEATLAVHPEGAIAPGARVSSAATVRRAVIRDGARVCDRAIVQDAIVLEGAIVEPGARVSRAIVAAGARVLAGAVLGHEDYTTVHAG